MGKVKKKVAACTSPRLLSTRSLVQPHSDIDAEKIMVVKIRIMNILNAVTSQLETYYIQLMPRTQEV